MSHYLLLLVAAAPAVAQPTARLSARILDAATGESVPATVTIRQPDGAVIREHPGYSRGFRCAGTFDKEVKPGPVTVTVRRGFDYAGETRNLDLQPGERKALTFTLHRRTPLRSLGWYCGDSHAHMIHGERRIPTDFAYAALAARAEALDYLSVAQRWPIDKEDPNAIERECRRVSTPDFRLTWNMEAPKNYWRGDVSHCMGHGWTFGMHGYTPDGRDAITQLDELSAHDYESEKAPAPNFESHALVHELGGIVSYTHPCRWWWGKWGGQGGYPVEEKKFVSNMAAELPFDVIAGPTFDTIDVLMQTHERAANEKTLRMWFMLLNRGYRIPATASSDATFDNPGGGVPGAVRVYTQVSGAPALDKIKASMKAGRSFVTSGPLALFSIGDHLSGDVVPVKGPMKLTASLRVWASGEPGEALTRIEVIRNGDVLKTFALDRPAPEFETSFEIRESGTAWYAVRAIGSSPAQIAITNPVYFEDASYRPPRAEAASVRLHVTGANDATCEVLNMVGLKPVVLSRHDIRNGTLALSVPATARLRVSAPGRRAVTKSIFAGTALLDAAFNLRDDQLTEWPAYEKIRSMLRNIELDFRLERQP